MRTSTSIAHTVTLSIEKVYYAGMTGWQCFNRRQALTCVLTVMQ